CVDGAAQLLRAIEAHNPVETGARAAQDGRHRGWRMASSTQKEHRQREEISVAGSAECSEHLVLLFCRDIQSGSVRHSETPGYVGIGEYPTYHTTVSLCQSYAL